MNYKKYNDLIVQNTKLNDKNVELKVENQNLIDRITYLEDRLENEIKFKKEKSTKKPKVTKKHG